MGVMEVIEKMKKKNDKKQKKENKYRDDLHRWELKYMKKKTQMKDDKSIKFNLRQHNRIKHKSFDRQIGEIFVTRFSKLMKKIIKLLQSNNKPISMEDVIKKLKDENPKSIYRAVQKLERIQIIENFYFMRFNKTKEINGKDFDCKIRRKMISLTMFGIDYFEERPLKD